MMSAKVCFLVLVLFGIGAAASAQAASPTPISACPYTISAPGNYTVTKNLTASGNCITIAANSITIDLQGHTITGNGVGIGVGNNSDDFAHQHIIIANGTIRKFDNGISGNIGLVTIANMTVGDNTGNGINTGNFGTVVDTVASWNGLAGITGQGGLISGVQADHNAFRGMVLQFMVISNSEANDNGDIGIWALDSSVLATTAKRNASDGFMLVGDINLIDDSTASGNGGNGISMLDAGGGRNSATNNVANNNAEAGFALGCPAHAFGNTAINNPGGDILTTDNTCACWITKRTKRRHPCRDAKSSPSLQTQGSPEAPRQPREPLKDECLVLSAKFVRSFCFSV
jgi:hypothetical protein